MHTGLVSGVTSTYPFNLDCVGTKRYPTLQALTNPILAAELLDNTQALAKIPKTVPDKGPPSFPNQELRPM